MRGVVRTAATPCNALQRALQQRQVGVTGSIPASLPLIESSGVESPFFDRDQRYQMQLRKIYFAQLLKFCLKFSFL